MNDRMKVSLAFAALIGGLYLLSRHYVYYSIRVVAVLLIAGGATYFWMSKVAKR